MDEAQPLTIAPGDILRVWDFPSTYFLRVYEASPGEYGGVKLYAARCRRDGTPKTKPSHKYLSSTLLASRVQVVR